MENKLKRPLGITVLGALHAIVGPVLMAVSLGAAHHAGGLLIFGLGAFELALGVGLLRLRPLALQVAIIDYALGIVAGIAAMHLAAGVISALILLYLCTTKVKQAFGMQPAHSAPVTASNS